MLFEKTAIVTGAASGIGYAVAQALRQEGAQVVMADVNEALLIESARKLGGVPFVGNLTRREDCRRLVDFTVERFGGVDILANVAGVQHVCPIEEFPEDKWDFAVGYGNYRDANSVAVGAFYRPDDDTMFSVGTNFGNGENMINAGVSFKFGPKGKSQVRPGSTQEITELRATVARQDDQLKKQDSEIKELKAMVQQLMAKQDKQATTK